MKNYLVDVSSLLDSPGLEQAIETDLEIKTLSLGGREVSLSRAPRLLGVLEGVGAGVMLRAEVTAEIEQECSRCLDAFVAKVTAPVEEFYERPGAKSVEGEAFPITEGKIDISPAVTQALLVELPFKPLCRADCAGLCPVCGKNLNIEPHRCTPGQVDARMSGLAGLKEVLEKERKRRA